MAIMAMLPCHVSFLNLSTSSIKVRLEDFKLFAFTSFPVECFSLFSTIDITLRDENNGLKVIKVI